MQGILIVDKPMEWTSFDVIAKLRGILGTRKLGHSGTLDPMATGVLPVFCGGASKAVDLQLDHTKTYCARLRLGMQTDTGDITGTVLETAPVTAGEKELLAVLPRFLGPQMQTPPMYSAVKINGQPLYKLAREGVTVERKARPIEILDIRYGGSPVENEYVLTVRCSKGTYTAACQDACLLFQGNVYPHSVGGHCRRYGPERHHERFAPHDGGCLHRGRRPHAGRGTGGKGRRPRGTAGFDAAGGERV